MVVRVYVLEARDLLPADSNGLADPFVVVSLGDESVGDSEWCDEATLTPKWFRCFELNASLPGDSHLRIEVFDWDMLSIGGAELMGVTTIDLEDRMMSIDWLKKRKKPIERRWLRHPHYGAGMYRGAVDLWVEVLDPKTAARVPPLDIAPPLPEKFELRVIVWRTRKIMDLDSEQSDQYVRCRLSLGAGATQEEQTDVHYFARRGKASFNYRMTFDVSLPDDSENASLIFTVLDFDMLTRDDVGGTAKLDLRNMFAQGYQQLHDLEIEGRALTFPAKEVREQALASNASRSPLAGARTMGFLGRDSEGNRRSQSKSAADAESDELGDGEQLQGPRWLTQRSWLKLSPPAGKAVDDFEGGVEVSIQLLPKSVAQKYPAARTGRAEPNTNPVLPEPSRPPALRMVYLGCTALWDEINAIVPMEKLLCTMCCLLCCGFLFFLGTHYGLLVYGVVRRNEARETELPIEEEIE